MKLYDSRGAPNPRRVRWFMAEKGVEDIEIVEVSIIGGEHKSADYLSRAGVANVPMLELDDGTTLTESLAICRYLESRRPEPNLLGRTPEEVAVIEMWTRRAELMIANPMMVAVRHTHPALAVLETQVPTVGQWSLGAAERDLPIFDRQLAGREWLAADRLTMADIVLFVGIDFARGLLKRPLPEALTNLTRWFAAMAARPAAKAGR